MAEEKDIYIKLMEDLIGRIDTNAPIYEKNDNDYNTKLKKSCNQFNEIMLGEEQKSYEKQKRNLTLFVGTNSDSSRPDNILEPCPIYYPNRNNNDKFRYAFIGLNPYKDAKLQKPEVNSFPKGETTWLRWLKYNCPEDKKELIKDSIYCHIAYNALGPGKYYDWAFRLHQALFHNVIYDNWKEFIGDRSEEQMREFFMNEFWDNPILSAEIIPYKSSKYKVTKEVAKKFIDDIDGYKDYIQHLLDFIYKRTNQESIIFFFGHSANVIDILFAAKDFVPFWPQSCKTQKEFKKTYEERVYQKGNSGKDNIFYFFRSTDKEQGERKIVIAPFLMSKSGNISLKSNDLIKKIKNDETYLPR